MFPPNVAKNDSLAAVFSNENMLPPNVANWFTCSSFLKWKYKATECWQMIHLHQFSQMKMCCHQMLPKNYSQASVSSNENMLQLKLLLFLSCLADLVLLINFLLLLAASYSIQKRIYFFFVRSCWIQIMSFIGKWGEEVQL